MKKQLSHQSTQLPSRLYYPSLHRAINLAIPPESKPKQKTQPEIDYNSKISELDKENEEKLKLIREKDR